MWLTHTRARARALSELTHRSHNEESQLHYWKSPEMPQCGKKGRREKRFCRLAEGRDSKCRRVESMSKQSESRREPGDTEEAQRIWLSLEPWQGILAECAYMCVCLIPPAEGVNAVIQNWGICVKPHRRTGSRLCFVLSRSVAPSQENIKTKGVAGKHWLSFQELKIPSVSTYNAGLRALSIGRPSLAQNQWEDTVTMCETSYWVLFYRLESRNCGGHCSHWLENCKEETRQDFCKYIKIIAALSPAGKWNKMLSCAE